VHGYGTLDYPVRTTPWYISWVPSLVVPAAK